MNNNNNSTGSATGANIESSSPTPPMEEDEFGAELGSDLPSSKRTSAPPQLPRSLQVTKECQLVPYIPLLPLHPADLVSYYQTARVTQFTAAASGLESTSLMFAWGGLDLFFAPVRPNKAWDILGDNFNFPVLYSITAAVTIGVVITHNLAQRKVLHDRWK